MDVRCERCSTEYEFDDALVSGRGTTVKCTNCGYKFKIRRSDGDYSEDFWNVTAGDGRTLVFTSLRELQRAIQSYLVDRHDRLSRGGLPPKPIGEIPELAPFFEQRERKGTSARPQRTQDGIGPISSADPESSTRSRQATKPEFPAPPPEGIPSSDTGKTTLIGTGPRTEQPAFQMNAPPQNITVPPPTTRQAAPPVHVDEPARRASVPPPVPARREASNTVPLQRSVPPAPPPRPPSVPPPLPRKSQPIAEPARTTSARPRAPSVPPPLPAPAVEQPYRPPPRSLLSEVDDQQHSEDDDSGEPSGLPRRRSTGLFVGIALAGAVAILGGAWAKKNLLVAPDAKPAAPVATTDARDERVASFLAAGEKALSEGSLDLAKESFDKASALAEKDPKVLLGLARLAAIRADSAWLKARLLPADATDEERINRDALGDRAATARNAADAALAVAPDDIAALRAKIDAARISGDRNGARALVAKIGSSATQSESAYVLAALDLTEEQPSWPSVIERLRLAANTESGAGRARAALVYALARSGDVPAAKAELERLSAMPKANVLLPLLRSYTERAKPAAHADAGAPVASGVGSAVAATAVATPSEAQEPSKGTHKSGGLPTDARELLQQGERARAKGDYDRAKTLFEAAIEKNPSDSEALAGLGAIAYAQHDLNGARSAYKRVIGINPNYMPAVIGLADVEWDSGDRATATRMYKDIVDRYPEGAYPGRVKQRAEGGG